MTSESEKLRQAMIESSREAKHLTRAINAMQGSVISFHRDFRLEMKRLRGECTCPWNENPLDQRGHHVACPSLKQTHSPDDDCDLEFAHLDKEL